MRISNEVLASLSIHFVIVAEKDIIISAKFHRLCDNLLNIKSHRKIVTVSIGATNAGFYSEVQRFEA